MKRISGETNELSNSLTFSVHLRPGPNVRRQLMIFIASGSLHDDVIYHDYHSFVQSLIAVGMANVT